MTCDNCGNDYAYRLRFTRTGMCCDKCGAVPSVYNPDVYFDQPYLDPHLIDPTKPEQKDGVWISSRREKADIMRTLGWREAGDRKHGCRVEDRTAQRMEREKGH